VLCRPLGVVVVSEYINRVSAINYTDRRQFRVERPTTSLAEYNASSRRDVSCTKYECRSCPLRASAVETRYKTCWQMHCAFSLTDLPRHTFWASVGKMYSAISSSALDTYTEYVYWSLIWSRGLSLLLLSSVQGTRGDMMMCHHDARSSSCCPVTSRPWERPSNDKCSTDIHVLQLILLLSHSWQHDAVCVCVCVCKLFNMEVDQKRLFPREHCYAISCCRYSGIVNFPK